MPSSDHVEEGTDPGPYNSNPPTSGPHYARSLNPGFYEQSPGEELPFPEGYLVHNLEHGYVIFWYNCQALPDGESCDGLKADIRTVMDEFDGDKLVAYPWESIEVPIALTSWGHRLRMERFDADAAGQFIERNRYRAPEPQAP